MAASTTRLAIVLLSLALISAGCTASANNAFFGATNPPRENVLRYVSGSEPESLDSQAVTTQSDQRICMALYEGLAELDPNPKLKAAVSGKQLVAVTAADVGVAAIDDYTLRISLMKPAPFFISMMPHVFFRVLHRKTIKSFDRAWTDAANIVTSGPFKLEAWQHYDRINVVRDPMYWDTKSVKLERIVFYLLQDNATMMNLYKAGELDATYNHTVPSAWLDVIGPMKDFMDAPEAAIDFYLFNTTRGPTSDVRVRKALNMSLNKQALADWRHVKPLTAMTPDGMFPGYPQPKGDPFDPEKAKQLLAEAGYRDAAGNFGAQKFAESEVGLITNPDANNLSYAEFIQAQWKQTLAATLPVRVME